MWLIVNWNISDKFQLNLKKIQWISYKKINFKPTPKIVAILSRPLKGNLIWPGTIFLVFPLICVY